MVFEGLKKLISAARIANARQLREMKGKKTIRVICIALILISIIAHTSTNAQKLKCKLLFQDSIYVGGMRPDWFQKITLTPLTSDITNIIGSQGIFYSNTFGNAKFSIVKNKLNTPDSLMIRATFGWHPINRMEIKKDALTFEWDWSFRPDPTLKDVEILNKADEILKDETTWDKIDDRNCKADSANSKFSLYCAIYQATIDVKGDFNHRGASLEMVRKTIREINSNKHYQHDIMDFNNQNSFDAIKSLLRLSSENLQKKLTKVSKKPN
jgi:hypothetical protein